MSIHPFFKMPVKRGQINVNSLFLMVIIFFTNRAVRQFDEMLDSQAELANRVAKIEGRLGIVDHYSQYRPKPHAKTDPIEIPIPDL